MDKITGHVTEIDVPVGGIANFGSFSILARKCVASSPEEAPEDVAFIDVVDNYESDNPVNIFKGWMFSSTPALSAVEHPIYDVWLLKCYNNTKIDKNTLLDDEHLALRDNLPMYRQEEIKVNIGEIADMTDVEPIEQPDTKNNTEIQTESTTEAESGSSLTDDDFVSEGEENLEPDILIDSRSDVLEVSENTSSQQEE